MSESGRLKLTKAGLVSSISGALIVCAGGIAYGLWESAKYERQAHNQSAEYAEYTRKKIAEACVGISHVEAIKCRYEAFDAQREYRYNQRDLVAQRQSALWAYIMGSAAVIGMALSALGVWLIKVTFDQTRRAADAAVAQASAYLIINAISITRSLPATGGASGFVAIKNMGTSPGKITELKASFFFDSIGEIEFIFSEISGEMVAGLQEKNYQGTVDISKLKSLITLFDDFYADETVDTDIHFKAETLVRYIDIFGVSYCQEFTGQAKTWRHGLAFQVNLSNMSEREHLR